MEAYFLSINKIKKNTTIYTNSHHYTSHFLSDLVLPGVGYTQQTPSFVKVDGARCLYFKMTTILSQGNIPLFQCVFLFPLIEHLGIQVNKRYNATAAEHLIAKLASLHC